MVRTIFLATALFALSACGGPNVYIVAGSARAAGADGQVSVEQVEGNNLVSIEMENLAPPGRISEGATVYAVWFVPAGSTPQLQGVLSYDPDDRTGRMSATTPQAEFQVVVSAEVDNTVQSPSEMIIIRQDVAAN